MSVIDYVKGTQAEMRHVTWPTRKQVAIYTATVVAISLLVAVILGALDFGFLRGLRAVIGGNGDESSLEGTDALLHEGAMDVTTEEIGEASEDSEVSEAENFSGESVLEEGLVE